jgi:uncharacterized membrane protein HdeD (DUF308 family)
MNLQSQSDPLDPRVEECLRLQNCWPWFFVLGVMVMVVGITAVSYAVFATVTTVLFFGSLLLVGGMVQVVNAFLVRSWRGFFVHLLTGILHMVIGALMVEEPLRAAEVLTFMLAAIFFVSGVVQIAVALQQRFSSWAWVLANGVVTLMLGVAVWRRWPEASYWVIGVCVGVDLIFNGWSWVMFGLVVKNAGANQPPVETRKHTEAVASAT